MFLYQKILYDLIIRRYRFEKEYKMFYLTN